MSYDGDDSHKEYGLSEENSGRGRSRGYGGNGGEADEYYNESQRPSGGRGNDDRRGEYGGQGGRRQDEERVSEGGYGGSGSGSRYDDNDNSGAGNLAQQGGGRIYDDENSGGGYGGSGGGYGGSASHGGASSGYDEDEAVSQARRHGNDEDSNLFSQAMSFLGQKKQGHDDDDDDDDLDEQQIIGAHQQLYGNQNSDQRPQDAKSLGAGAAMQALKMFTGGGSGGAGGMGSQGGGNSQSQFIGMAMAQAGRLFDQQSGQGNVTSSTDKQSAVTSAAKMALRMYMKSEGRGGGGGGGPGGLLGMAGKFM